MLTTSEVVTIFFLKSFLISAVFTASTIYMTRNPVYSLISLILTFLFSGFFLITLSQDFLGLTLIIVYVGAITVLLLFVIMTLNIRRYEAYIPLSKDPLRVAALLAFTGFLYFGITHLIAGANSITVIKHMFYSFLLKNPEFPKTLYYITTDSILTVGNHMYTTFSVLFILASLILLVVMIGALLIAQGDKTDFKKQSATQQVNRNPKKCLTMYPNKK